MNAEDRIHMARALRLAARGRFTSAPNPQVGCVILREGEIVGEGWHRRAGEPHAERLALQAAGARAAGATAYVTLEPCCHQGRTPPCTEALLSAGIARVVVAMEDPNPLVAGKGLAQLRAAGVQVRQGVLEDQARALNPGFIKRMEQGLPFLCCKLAASLDGRTALASGESQWITGTPARREVQFLRARSGAVLTGIGTVLQDDPSLNVRLDAAELPGYAAGEAVRQPLRVVLDSRLRFPPTAKMLNLPGQTLIACAQPDPDREARLIAAGAQVYRCPQGGDRVHLETLLRHLAQREINEVLLESGPTLAGAALQAGLVDEIQLYLAPHLLGDGARGLFHLPGLAQMSQRLPLRIREVRWVGADLCITLTPELSS